MSGTGKANAPIIPDEFDFGLTPQGTLWDGTAEIDKLKNQCITDPLNGLWSGWVFMKVITDRFRTSAPLDAPMYSYYMKVDPAEIVFFKD